MEGGLSPQAEPMNASKSLEFRAESPVGVVSVDPVVAGSSPVVLAVRKDHRRSTLLTFRRFGSAAFKMPVLRELPQNGSRMARPRNPIPTARCHKGSAVVDVYHGGKRRTVTLGPWGSVQAEKEFARILAEGNSAAGTDPTIAEIFLAFLKHAEAHYRQPDGTTSPEVDEYKALSKFTRELYAHTPAREFGPLALKTLREALVGRGLCRRIVNQRIGRLKRVFKWAASEELLPFDVFHRLTTVPGLQLGRTLAREAEPVVPVDDATVEATLPFLSRHVRGLVRFQRLTGCRPGEACRVKPSEIDMTGEVWLFRPSAHKGAWRGKPRTIAIGARAQAVLKEFAPEPDGYYFSPRQGMAEFRAGQRAKRQTPITPSQKTRKRTKHKKQLGERYTTRSYTAAVAQACQKGKLPRWCPLQLRHTFATVARKEHGLEAAQVLLGHSKADVTQVYAERNLDLAVNVAAKIG